MSRVPIGEHSYPCSDNAMNPIRDAVNREWSAANTAFPSAFYNLSFSLAGVRLDVDLIDGLDLCEGICTGVGG